MKFKVVVTQVVEVELNPRRFTQKFMREFRDSYYPFRSLEDHAKHIAQLEARGLLGNFIEGYGHAADMGISAAVSDQDEELES